MISQNVANANTTAATFDEVYKRQVAHVTSGGNPFSSFLPAGLGGSDDAEEMTPQGVTVSLEQNLHGIQAVPDPSDPSRMIYKPNVNIIEEMTNLMAANRAYEANATVAEAGKGFYDKAISIDK